jgi:acetyl-CoA C-acetyltransferase
MKRPITPRGYNALRTELQKLKAMRPELARAIEVARGHGDLSENGDYDAAKEKSGMTEAKIRDIEAKLSMADIIDPRKLADPQKVVFGVSVRIEDVNSGEARTLAIVGADESDADRGWISIESPLGRGLIGNFGGSLIGVGPAELGRVAAVAALERASDDTAKLSVDEVIVGNVLGAGHGMNIARQICIRAGLPTAVPAYAVNKVCGSGLKAVTLGAQAIALGEANAVLVGGVESMSQAPFVTLGARWGGRLGHMTLADLMLSDGLTDVFHGCHMGITAENLATKFEVSRAEQDDFALQSQRKAAHALAQGWFKEEIAPVLVEQRGKEPLRFDVDEYVRGNTTAEALAKLKPAFKKDGSVTAGNASGINDGGGVSRIDVRASGAGA